MNEIPEAELPLIDPRKDDDKVWILIDEGCNSICHGEHWRQEAEKIMPGCIKKIGITGSSYTGVGNAECTGVYMIYFCIKLDPSGMCLRGSFKSNELKGSDTPLLLSLPGTVEARPHQRRTPWTMPSRRLPRPEVTSSEIRPPPDS